MVNVMILSLRAFVEQASQMIEVLFAEHHYVIAMFQFVTGDDQKIIMPFNLVASDEELAMPVTANTKDECAARAREVFAAHKAKRYVLIDEAWRIEESKITPEVEAAVRNNVSLENIEGRVETVIFYAEDRDSGRVSAHRDIIRKVNSRPRLGPLVFDGQGPQLKGRMFGLLPRGNLSS
jgi:hypothetical protein